MCETLNVVRQVAGEIHDGHPETGFGADPALGEPRLDPFREHVGRDLLQSHHRSGFVEGTARADHLLHQARLRPCEDVADLALVLRGGADARARRSRR